MTRPDALALLRELGAERIPHPGGTLLAHLTRVEALLESWGARPELRLAGLCHAFYGTDGFATALLPVTRRAELAAVIGTGAEETAYLYACCDRSASYPSLAAGEPAFRDRFTGRLHTPDLQARRDFAELTAANELDLARTDPVFRATYGPDLRGLFARWQGLLSGPALRECRAVLGEA
ncbi:hypothetical protein HYE82_21045 [Streptomyces sp. BR123]|uniref:DUF6817 domain-containing protein n=1 Tax=Streptomyces sp. BR123 TaxID=2749828 RepID=UPI0015C4644C|nr:hypothetical protein [Streptomyces sp. BR123]NXY96826.1 hypothetical protein [Streptomyces sp. BR123]